MDLELTRIYLLGWTDPFSGEALMKMPSHTMMEFRRNPVMKIIEDLICTDPGGFSLSDAGQFPWLQEGIGDSSTALPAFEGSL